LDLDHAGGISDFPHAGPGYQIFLGPTLDPQQTAVRQIEALGFSTKDVTDLLLTHLDLDHAGGISDFPHANVHVMATEYEAAQSSQPHILQSQRYRPIQWKDHKNWAFHSITGEEWLGFEAIRPLPGTDDQILMVPLAGHTKGHAGFAIHSGAHWLFHAGDCYYSHASMNLESHRLPTMLAQFEKLMANDDEVRTSNVERLRNLKREYRTSVDIFCSHDPYDLKRLIDLDAN
jgi:glyoxylase-like metal-dependent hydrolase (beta-lactamase superfamily II)